MGFNGSLFLCAGAITHNDICNDMEKWRFLVESGRKSQRPEGLRPPALQHHGTLLMTWVCSV